MLVALKCDLREEADEKDANHDAPPKPIITYTQGLEVAKRIGALRYLGMGYGQLWRMYMYNETDGS